MCATRCNSVQAGTKDEKELRASKRKLTASDTTGDTDSEEATLLENPKDLDQRDSSSTGGDDACFERGYN